MTVITVAALVGSGSALKPEPGLAQAAGRADLGPQSGGGGDAIPVLDSEEDMHLYINIYTYIHIYIYMCIYLSLWRLN